ncbi:metallophosphoesterase [Croceiramulus getboli]|nr:metallophosphoesterase [Flavobacteriaceae bacterium YJPT1-3]
MRWILPLVFYILIDIYAFQALKTVTDNKWIHYAYLALSLLVLGNVFYQTLTPSEVRLSSARSYAFGLLLALVVPKLLIVIFMFGEDVLRGIVSVYERFVGGEDRLTLPSRRKFVSTLALTVAAIPFASLLYGMYRGKYNFRVLEYELTFPDLPDAFDGYQITQISDIHSGSFDNFKEIEYAVNLINEQGSDAILFTGDLVNNKAEEMNPWKELFGQLTASDGVYSVLGNHDYGDYVSWESQQAKERNLEDLKSLQREMGWDLLLNEHRYIERQGDRLALVGVENWGAGGFKKKGDLDRAVEPLHPDDFTILLSHDPSHWKEKVQSHPKKVHLTLSGHTHGMQFGIEIPGWIKWSPVQYRYEHWAGIYSDSEQFINVNRGLGFLGYPGRVGIWPEISVIRLKKSGKA